MSSRTNDHTGAEAAEAAEQLEFQTGRRAPYSMVGDWVLMADIHPQAKALYWALSAHVNNQRDDTVVWPSLDVLAEILGYSEGRKLRPYMTQLIELDAITVRQAPPRYVGGLRRTRRVYIVNQSPPEGYAGMGSLREFYAARKSRLEAERAANDQAALQDMLTGDAGADGGEENRRSAPGGPNGPLGDSDGEIDRQGAEMGPLEGAEMGPLVRGRNGPPNKTNYNQTKANQTKSGGHPAAPRTPADKNRGHLGSVVTDKRKSVGDQQTARAQETAYPAEQIRRSEPISDVCEPGSKDTEPAVATPSLHVVASEGPARQTALAVAAEAKKRGAVRGSARKSVPDLPRRAAERAAGVEGTPA